LEQWGFFFDQTRCVNCKTCVLACKAWNEDRRGDAGAAPELAWIETGGYATPAEYDNLPGSDGRQNFKEFSKYHMKENLRRIYTVEYGDKPPDVDVLHMSVSCNHCREPICVRVCPAGHIRKEREFGIVLTDPSKPCVSCRRCEKVCPWGSPQYFDDPEKYAPDDARRPRMTKCDLCIGRIRDGLKPACVAACIMRALDAGPMTELKARYPDWTDALDDFPDGGLSASGAGTKPSIVFRKRSVVTTHPPRHFCPSRNLPSHIGFLT
jgi:anaerobic dimethyl sulfoxide reductase subunit B (iron-sulfur subunit)